MPATSFVVGAIFEVQTSEAQEALTALSDKFAGLDELIKSAQASLAGLGRGDAGLFGGLTTGLSEVSRAMTELGTNIESVAAKITSAMGEAIRTATAAARATADAASAAMSGGGRGPGGTPRFINPPGSGSREAPPFAVLPESPAFRLEPEPSPFARGGGTQGSFDLGRPDEPLWRTRPDLEIPPFPGVEPGAVAGGVVGATAARRGGHGLLHGMAPMVEGIGTYEAYKAAMQENYSQRQTISTLGYDPDSEAGQGIDQRLRSMLIEQTRGTIFSEEEASIALRRVRPVMGLTGEPGVQRAEDIFPSALRLGELSKMRGKGDVSSEAVAGVQFAHLEQRFDKTGVQNALDIVNRVAKANDTSVAAQESIMKYAIPTALAAGVAPDAAVAEIGVAEQTLGATSTAGTGYSQFVLGALKSKSGVPARLHTSARAAEREFENALRLDGEDVSKVHKEIRGPAHDLALERLGVTKGGKIQDVTPSGGLDEERLKQQIADYAAHHDRLGPEGFNATLQDAFGVRGGRYAERYAESGYIDREREQMKTATTGQTVQQEQASLAKAPLQQFEQMLANMNNIGNTLATATLPGVNTALMALNQGLVGLNDFLKGHPVAAEVGGYGLLGAAAVGVAGWGAKIFGPGWNLVKGLFGGGGAAAAADAAPGAIGGGLSAAGGAAARVGGGLLATNWISGMIADVIQGDVLGDKSGVAYRHKKEEEWSISHRMDQLWNMAFPTTDKVTPRQVPDRGGAPSYPPSAPSTVNQTITINVTGVPDEAGYKGIISRITSELRSALSTATGTAQGVHESPYMYGSGP